VTPRRGRTPTAEGSPGLRSGGLSALRLLEMCPLLPVDAFVHLTGLDSCSSAYQQLARLKRAGLADRRSADLGYLLGERRLGLWTITDRGRFVLRASRLQGPGRSLETRSARTHHQDDRGDKGIGRRESNVPLLVAAYRLLAWLVGRAPSSGGFGLFGGFPTGLVARPPRPELE
jgi:hypothetical protein